MILHLLPISILLRSFLSLSFFALIHHPQAEYGLGLCYASGHGVKADAGEAVKWYRKAAERGHTEATWKLGECYRHGTGVVVVGTCD